MIRISTEIFLVLTNLSLALVVIRVLDNDKRKVSRKLGQNHKNISAEFLIIILLYICMYVYTHIYIHYIYAFPRSMTARKAVIAQMRLSH